MSTEQGFVAVPNWVFDKVMPMLCAHKMQKLWAAYSLILRKTYGFNKASDAIPAKQFEGVGIKDEKTLTTTINELVDLGLVTVVRQNGRTNIYSFISLDTENHPDSTTTVKPPRFNPTTPNESTPPPRMNQGATTPNESGASTDNTTNNTQQTVSVTPTAPKPAPKPKAEPKVKTDENYNPQKLIDLGCSEQLAKDFIVLRKNAKKPAPLTPTAINLIASQASKAGIEFSRAVEICIARNWVSFNASWKWQDDKPIAQYPVTQKTPYQSAAERTAAEQQRWADFLNGSPDERDVTPKKSYLISEVGHA